VNPYFRLFVVAPRDPSQFRLWPSLVQQIAIELQDDIHAEVLQRDLLVCVEDSHRHEVTLRRGNIEAFPDPLKVAVFDRVKSEDIFLLLLETAPTFAARARDHRGRSILDIAMEKGYLKAASLAHDLGAQSEVIDLQCFLDVSFQPMLDVLLDVRKSFPFDAKAVLRAVALGERYDILRRMFECRIDRDCAYSDYPVLEALYSGHPDIAQLVVDRLGIVGCSPLYDGRVALYFALRILSLGRALTELELLWGCRFFESAAADDLRGVVRRADVESLSDFHPGHKIIVCALRAMDVEATALIDDPVMIASLFVKLDPSSPKVCDALACAVLRLSGTAQAQDEALHNLVRGLARASAEAFPTLVALCGMLSHERLSMTYKLCLPPQRRRTQIMQCLEYPPNPQALALFLSRVPQQGGLREVLETGNEVGNTALQQCLVEVCSDPLAALPHAQALGTCIALLLSHGAAAVDPSYVKVSMLQRVARTEIPTLAWAFYENMKTKESLILAASDNLRALLYAQHGSGTDTRIDPGTPQDQHGMPPPPPSLLRVPVTALECICTFLTPKNIAQSMMTVSIRMHYATLADSVWSWRISPSCDDSCPTRLLHSAKKIYRDKECVRMVRPQGPDL